MPTPIFKQWYACKIWFAGHFCVPSLQTLKFFFACVQHGETALRYASNFDVVALLVKAGADVNLCALVGCVG